MASPLLPLHTNVHKWDALMKKVILLTVALVIDWLSVAMAQVWVNPQEFTH